MDAEKVQLATEGPVVSALGLFQPLQMLYQTGIRLEGCPVDTLQHWAFLVTTPIGAGHAQQFHGRNVRCAMHVGALAQIHEIVMAVDGDYRIFGKAFDKFDLVGLVGEHGLGISATQILLLEGKSAFDGLLHQLLNLFQVLWGERTRNVEVVVKAILGGRADAHFGFGK